MGETYCRSFKLLFLVRDLGFRLERIVLFLDLIFLGIDTELIPQEPSVVLGRCIRASTSSEARG